jgi:hypothetical protein
MKKGELLERVETVVMVTVIAVLVWLYAEGENVQPYNNERLQVKFVAPPGQDLAIDPSRTEVLASFRASSGKYRAFKDMVGRGAISVEVSDKDNASEQVVVLKDVLGQTSLVDIGINLLETDPPTKTLRVERIEEVTLPIEVDWGDLELAQPPTKEPLEAVVKLPASLASQAEGQKLVAKLDPEELKRLAVNVPLTREVPLALPPALQAAKGVTLNGQTVKVTFTIKNQTDTFVPPSIPIHLNAPPPVFDQYSIELDQEQRVLAGVTLTGAANVIETIKSGEVKVWAELRLRISDVKPGVQSVVPFVVVPPGVTFDPPPPVQVTITPRQ